LLPPGTVASVSRQPGVISGTIFSEDVGHGAAEDEEFDERIERAIAGAAAEYSRTRLPMSGSLSDVTACSYHIPVMTKARWTWPDSAKWTEKQ
jgi:hypothetical protein